MEDRQFILCKASEERVGVLQCTNKKWSHKYNDLDTLSFDISYITDGTRTPFYEDIDIFKYILVPSVGLFVIKDITTNNEATDNEYKSVECQDYSSQISQRYLEDFVINMGTTESIDSVSFYNPGNQPYSLMHLVLEKLPEWSVGHCDAALWTKRRSFEVTRQDIYSFLMKDVAEAFECVFVFNTISKQINIYEVENVGIDTNIHLSYNNLLERAELSLSLDEIKTCVTIKGDDDLTVREVNMGYDTLYNIDYFADLDHMSASLLDAYTTWKNLVNTTVDLDLFTYKTGVITRAELSGKSYKDAYTLLLAKYQNYYTQISKWNSTLIPYGVNTRKPGYGTISYTEDGSDAVTFSRQTSTVLVTSLPSSGDSNTLYLIKDTNNMYRWNGSWVDVNKWYNCCLATLKEKLASFENTQAVAMKAGYGDSENTDTTIHARYIDTYLPSLYSVNAITKQIDTVKNTISGLESDQAIIQTDKTVIVNKTAMKNNFTAAQLKELSTFIREEELSTDNYVVTDVMTEDERFEMLYALLEYGQKELAKVSTPQLQFSVDMVNLFAISEFDIYSGDFDLGNYVWVTIRDDYSIKAKILEISIDFTDPTQFSVTFGNVARKARNIFTDVTDALNAATSAATSVSFGASNWSAAAQETDSIGKALADGLLSQSYYLANAEDNETLIDENGVWITTTTGDHGREQTDDYDAIYLGGGRILFTDDGWRSVSMSVGRAEVQMPSINSSGELIFTKESLFGTFADFVIAGYVAGSTIVGGDIYSSNYKTSSNKNSGNRGTHMNLNDGTFEFNNNGKKRLTLNSSGVLEVNGVIQASSGHIGSDDNGDGGFVIENKKLYNGKSSFNGTTNGIYLNSDEGISLGAYNSSTGKNPFSVNNSGYLVSASGSIGGWSISNSTLSSGNITIDAGNNKLNFNNKFIVYNDGSFQAANNKFSVNTAGEITSTGGTIGGWTIGASSLSANNITINSSGSITQETGGTSNWSITSTGYAYFKNVFITGVNSGSTFGNMGYSGDTYNWGTFGGGSLYGSTTSNPFSGQCVTHIQTLAVGEITAERVSARAIEAGFIKADTIAATYATLNELHADYITANSISATYATITSLEVVDAKFQNINADNITAGTVSTSRLNIDGIVQGMQGKDIDINGLEVHGYLTVGNYLATWHVITIDGFDIKYLGRD